MELLYKDDRVVVCIKKPGLLSTDEPGGAPDAIRAALGEPEAVLRSVHRLDRVVGGVMVYARTRRAASDLGAQIRAGAFEKEYLAVVAGEPPQEEGELRDWLLRDTAARRTIVVPEGTPGAKEAILYYKRLACSGGASALSVRLMTGRTHQIRCQLAGMGTPIIGDTKYGGGETGSMPALWSQRISFYHPRTGERLCFFALPPDVWPWTLLSGMTEETGTKVSYLS